MTKTPSSNLDAARKRAAARSHTREFYGPAGPNPSRARVTLDLNSEAIANLDAVKNLIGGEVTNTEAVRQSLAGHRLALKALESPGVGDELSKDTSAPISVSLAGNRKQIIERVGVLIAALQEAIDYDSLERPNVPPPALHVHNQNYMNDVRSLVKELKRLNDLLEKGATTSRSSAVAKATAAYLVKFANTGMPLLSYGTHGMLLYVIADLLEKMGLKMPGMGQMISTIIKVVK